MSLNPLAQINLITMIAVVAIFIVTFLVLRRMCFAPVIAVMARRAAKIDAARANKLEADGLLETARHEAEEIIAAARTEAERIAEKSRQEASERRSQALARATTEAEAILAKGRADALKLRRSEDERLRAELHSSVSRTVARLIDHVDDAAVRLMVNRVLQSTRAG